MELETNNIFRKMGELKGLQMILQNSTNSVITENNNIKVNVMSYQEGKARVPNINAQLYNLELMFPPEIAFLDGMVERAVGEVPEFIKDLEAPNSFCQIATIEYKLDNKVKKAMEIALNGEVINPEFIIGYAQGSMENNENMKNLGLNSYVCSVIVDHNFRMISGVGSRLMNPIFSEIDKHGKSYLSTWVDTGSSKKINTSHPPGVGFWFNQHYDLLSKKDATKYINGLKDKHLSAGIVRDNYDLKEVKPKELEKILYNTSFERRLGRRGTQGRDYFEKQKESFAIIPNHYENGWGGIIMVRDPELVKMRENNPVEYKNGNQ